MEGVVSATVVALLRSQRVEGRQTLDTLAQTLDHVVAGKSRVSLFEVRNIDGTVNSRTLTFTTSASVSVSISVSMGMRSWNCQQIWPDLQGLARTNLVPAWLSHVWGYESYGQWITCKKQQSLKMNQIQTQSAEMQNTNAKYMMSLGGGYPEEFLRTSRTRGTGQ